MGADRRTAAVRRLVAPELSWAGETQGPPPLKRGSRGYDVKTLSLLLHARGIELNGNINDTVFGDLLEDALRRFQKEAGLKVDGECGPKTWPKLLRVD